MSVAEEYGFNFADEPCEYFLWRKYPCRKCLPCLHRRQQEWVSRLTEELRQHDNNYFITLTYSDDYVPVDENGLMCFDNRRIIKLNRDLRKRFQVGRFRNLAEYVISGSPEFLPLPKDQKIKYYITSEYCPNGTHRPHYHAVYYNLGVDLYTAELLFRSLWPDGFITVLPAYESAAGYISKYLCKDVVTEESYTDYLQQSPIAIMSKGLGLSYVERMYDWHRADPSNRKFFQFHGEKKTLSRYYKLKLYTDEERQDAFSSIMFDEMELRHKYNRLRITHPERFKRLMEERSKFYEDMKDREQWNYLKKQSM